MFRVPRVSQPWYCTECMMKCHEDHGCPSILNLRTRAISAATWAPPAGRWRAGSKMGPYRLQRRWRAGTWLADDAHAHVIKRAQAGGETVPIATTPPSHDRNSRRSPSVQPDVARDRMLVPRSAPPNAFPPGSLIRAPHGHPIARLRVGNCGRERDACLVLPSFRAPSALRRFSFSA